MEKAVIVWFYVCGMVGCWSAIGDSDPDIGAAKRALYSATWPVGVVYKIISDI